MTSKYLGYEDEMMQSSAKSYSKRIGEHESRKLHNFEPGSGRSQENEML